MKKRLLTYLFIYLVTFTYLFTYLLAFTYLFIYSLTYLLAYFYLLSYLLTFTYLLICLLLHLGFMQSHVSISLSIFLVHSLSISLVLSTPCLWPVLVYLLASRDHNRGIRTLTRRCQRGSANPMQGKSPVSYGKYRLISTPGEITRSFPPRKQLLARDNFAN